MGYKMAGYNVLGCEEIDYKMMDVYLINHYPKYFYLEDIRTFKEKNDLPQELYNLDILDGSPPCSNFSIAGNREKDWGKEKKFREGQVKQVLDTLFFDFIDLTKKLQPKIVIAENVEGILFGNAIKYTQKIIKGFEEAGYHTEYWLLDSSKMGLPQRRKRVFFISIRKDIAEKIPGRKQTLISKMPYLNLYFDEKEISFEKATKKYWELPRKKLSEKMNNYYSLCKEGNSFSSVHEKGSFFNCIKINRNRPAPTLPAKMDCIYHPYIPGEINIKEAECCFSWPHDYKNNSKYIMGMSVPPIMVANIAYRIYEQWLKLVK